MPVAPVLGVRLRSRLGDTVVDSSDSGRRPVRSRRRELPTLEPFYYLKNFDLVLATLAQRYHDLLSVSEATFIAKFALMSRESRALLVRMVTRQGELFFASDLSYPEIGDTRCAAEPLTAAGWVEDRPHLTISQLATLLPKPDLVKTVGLPARFASRLKAELIQLLAGLFPDRREYADWCPGDRTETVYALTIAPLCERFRLLFFGNYRQSWSEFVTADLGIFKYEQVTSSVRDRAFQTRDHIDCFMRLRECQVLFQAGMPPLELLTLVPSAIDCDWLEERRQQLLFEIARAMERTGEEGAALKMYLMCTHRGARTRAIRLHARAQQWAEARALGDLAREKPECEGELQFLHRAMPRVYKQLGQVPPAIPTCPSIAKFELVLRPRSDAYRVEYQVRDHLARKLTDRRTVSYVENELINSLFGLLCWPAIFAPLPGAFFHSFHRGPADLLSPHFYRRREGLFQSCLGLLDSGRYHGMIRRTFKEKWGIDSPFVRWHALDRHLFNWALSLIPPAHLRAWFEWMLRDLRENCAGFPDLVQFFPEKGTYRLIEVKGPGDRLQDNQRRFLEYCVEKAVPVSVCHVSWRQSGPEQATLDFGF